MYSICPRNSLDCGTLSVVNNSQNETCAAEKRNACKVGSFDASLSVNMFVKRTMQRTMQFILSIRREAPLKTEC